MKHTYRKTALPPAGASTSDALLLAYQNEKALPLERLSHEALAGLLVLMEGSPLNAALAVKATVEGHYLRRALPAIREAEGRVSTPAPIAPTPPNPGSDAAIASGCSCAVLDNGHGWGAWGKQGQFWVTQGCPLHDTGQFNDG